MAECGVISWVGCGFMYAIGALSAGSGEGVGSRRA